jgi:hypothetical protein
MSAQFYRGLVLTLFSGAVAHGANIIVNDSDGVLGATHAPVTASIKLSQRQRAASVEGRLQLREIRSGPSSVPVVVPVQLLPTRGHGSTWPICWLMPAGPKGKRTFQLQEIRQATAQDLVTKQDPASGQYYISDAARPVLRYNYATIEPGDLLTNITAANRIYARARSDYIHPLFGLDGETLTRDWSVDHPHHRGIYWAWPEVDWHGQRGDLHALQHVFARPTGTCSTTSGPVFAQIEAENVWNWENGESLVHERAVLRAYNSTGNDRNLDLEFQFTALNDPVLLARRGTDKYGGLNVRLAPVQDQEVVFHTDRTNAAPRMAWAELSGRFGDSPRSSGIVVLQHNGNPDYPGDWVKFPELNWFQPTFPASGTRYELRKDQPLVLRFRLWLHHGAKASEEDCAAHWRAYHDALAPKAL